MGWNGTTIQRSGGSFAMDGAAMDLYLSEEDTEVLYRRWDGAKWGEPLTLNGGVKSITTDMVLAITYKDLSSVYGVKRANLFIEAAKQY